MQGSNQEFVLRDALLEAYSENEELRQIIDVMRLDIRHLIEIYNTGNEKLSELDTLFKECIKLGVLNARNYT